MTIMKNAGDKLDRSAQQIKQTEKVNYAEALNLASKRNPELARAYVTGNASSTVRFQR